jgi:hypothetical protein
VLAVRGVGPGVESSSPVCEPPRACPATLRSYRRREVIAFEIHSIRGAAMTSGLLSDVEIAEALADHPAGAGRAERSSAS